MKVVFMGTPDFAVSVLEKIIEKGHEVAAVITQPDKAKGRKMELAAPPVKECAVKNGIEVFQPVKVKNNIELFEKLEKIKPDVIVVVAFGQILPKQVLDLPKFGCINVHASLLPKYRGAAPIQWAVIDGEEKSGVTIMKMDEGLDTGNILKVREVVLSECETGGSLFDKLAVLGAEALTDTLYELELGTIEERPQEGESTYAGKLSKELGKMDFGKSALTLERLVRGLNPWPSAYTMLDGKTLKIWKATVINEKSDEKPGTVIKVDKEYFYVSTGDGILRIDELQLEGKKRMETNAFLRGFEICEGTVL